jgi:hypothetical protein
MVELLEILVDSRSRFNMVTKSAIPDATNLDQNLESRPRRPRPEMWPGHVTECVVAARAPILTAVIYFVFLVMPDQTAEVIRSTFEMSPLLLIPVLVFWFILTIYLCFAFYAATRIALAGLAGKSAEGNLALDRTQRGVMYAVTLSPLLALWIAFWESLDPNTLVAFWDWKVLLFLLPTTFFGLFVPSTLDGLPSLPSRLVAEWGLLIGAAIIGVLLTIVMIVGLFALRIFSSYFGITAFAAGLPPVLIFSAWIIFVLTIFMALAEFWKSLGVPAIVMLVIWALLLAAFDKSDNHVLRTVGTTAAEPPEVGAVFDAWIGQRATDIEKYNSSNRKYPVFLVVAEGGGARAAYTTTLVLEALRQYCPDAIRHTFLVTAVSGGSVGALLASAGVNWDGRRSGCDRRLPQGGQDTEGSLNTTATNAAGVDFLSPVLRGFLFGDIPVKVWPSSLLFGETLAWLTDPAQYLERSIDRAWRKFDKSNERNQHSLSNTGFGKFWTGGSSAAPALVLLTTDVTSGRRVAVSHLRIPSATLPANNPVSEGRCLQQYPGEQLESRARLLTLGELEPGIDVSVVTAAVLSARFPGITAAGRLPCSGPTRRLVDGGYFENSGLTTVLDLLDTLRKSAKVKDVSFVIVQIENGRASSDWSFAKGKPPAPPSSWLPELMSPIRTIVGTRQARADLARVALKASVPNEAECTSQPCDYRVLFELRPCKTPIPLGWSLSEAAQKEIRRQLFDPHANGAEQECIGGVPPDRSPPATNVTNVMRFDQIFQAARAN